MRRTTSNAPVATLAQAKLDSLNATAAALRRAGIRADQVLTVMRPDIERAEQETGRKVISAEGSAELPQFTFAPRLRPKSYARVRKPNQVRFLSGMVEGVWVVVNLHKPGVYRHDNRQVAEALRTLVAAIERARVPLADQDTELDFDPEQGT
jgi:hypothetical protein